MLATSLTLVAAAWLGVALLALAPRHPGYSHVRDTISELGESGARDQRLVAFGVFLPIGALLLGAAWVLRAASPVAFALAACVAAGYLGAALFPCDPGSPAAGSWRQSLHNLAGAIEYIGGALALVSLARELGTPFKIAGALVLACGLGLSFVPPRAGRGALQRVAECLLFGSLAVAAWRLGPTR